VRRSRLHATPATACVTSLGRLATHLTSRVPFADPAADAFDAAAGGVASAGRAPLAGGLKCEANEAADECKRSDDPLPKLTGTFTRLRFRDGCPDNGRCLPTSELESCAAVRVACLCAVQQEERVLEN
jgi:hypothetical protein